MSANLVASLILRLVDRLSGPARTAVRSVGDVGRAQRLAAQASAQWSKGLEELDDKLGRLAKASIVTDGLNRAGERMMRPLAASARAAISYEEALAAIGDTADMTADRVARMDRAIMGASRMGRGAPQIADAAGIFIAGGLDDDVAGRLLGVTTRVVVGARVSFEDAARAAMAFNTSLQVTPELMERAFDAAAYAAKAGMFELPDMAQYLPSIGAQAARRGLTGVEGVAEVTAALTTIRDQTGEASEAATYLRDLFMKMDANETAANFAKFGVDVRKRLAEEEAKGRSALDAIMDITLEARAKGAQYNQLFTDAQAQLGIAALIDGRQRFDDIRSSAAAAGGTVERSYQRMRATDAERLRAYAAAMERLGLAAGRILAPAVGLAANVLERVSDWMARAGASGSILARVAVWATAGFAGLAVAAGAIGHAVVGILGPIFIMRAIFGKLGGAAVKGAFANIVGGLARARLAALAFNASLLANPVVLGVALAVAAVAAVALVVRKYWQPIRAFFTGVGQALGEAFGPALSTMAGLLSPLKPLWDGVAGAVGAVFGWIGRLLAPVVATDEQLASATNAGRAFGRMLGAAFNLTPLGLFLTGVRMLGRAWPSIAAGARAAVGGVSAALGAFGGGVAAFFGGLARRFGGFGRALMQGLVGGIRSMLGAVRDAVMETATAAVNWFRDRLGIRSPSRVFAGLGVDVMAGLTQGLTRGGAGAVGRVAGVAGALVGAMAAPGAVAQPADRPGAEAGRSGASGGSGGVYIETLTIHVTVAPPPPPPGGGGRPPAAGGDSWNPRQLGRDIGRAAADALRARLYDGAE